MAKKSVPNVILQIPKEKVIVQGLELLQVEKRKSRFNVGFAKIAYVLSLPNERRIPNIKVP